MLNTINRRGDCMRQEVERERERKKEFEGREKFVRFFAEESPQDPA